MTNLLQADAASLRDALDGWLRRARAPAGTAGLPSAQGMCLQMLARPIPWNWPLPALGMTPPEAYALFDTMPASTTGVTYVPSLMSFSRNYAAWLELLRPDALPRTPSLQSELDANRPPDHPSGPLPPGWTRVNTVAEGLVAWRMVRLP